MEEYPKIETLFDRDETFKVIVGKWRLPEFEYLKDCNWFGTEKIDGTNIRVSFDGEKIIVGGRTDNAQMPIFLLNKLRELFTVPKLQQVFSVSQTSLILFGEGYGAKIQKGGGNYIPNGVDFALFDVKVDKWWLKWEDVCGIASSLGIETVPLVYGGNLAGAVTKVQHGMKSTYGDFIAEGMVLKPQVELFNRRGQRIVGKIKTKDLFK